MPATGRLVRPVCFPGFVLTRNGTPSDAAKEPDRMGRLSCFPCRCKTGKGSSAASAELGVGDLCARRRVSSIRLRRLHHGVCRPKKFAQIRAFGLVRRRIQRVAAMSKMVPFSPRQASHRYASALPIACAYPATRKHRYKKTALNTAFLIAASLRRESRCARFGAMRGSSPSSRRDGVLGGTENNFAKLLTH